MTVSMANLNDEGWDESAEEMQGLLPNPTAVMAIMDELYQAFKDALKYSTHM